MNMRESALWKSFRKALPADAMTERIENSLGSGMPDVLLTCGGNTMLVELKAELEIARKQADWARRWAVAGGVSWFLIAINRNYYLVPGPEGGRLIKHPTTLHVWRVHDIHAAVDKMLWRQPE